MNLPDDSTLPFFSYGLFKPGELCYSRISDLVQHTKKSTIKGFLKERDGIPLLVLENGAMVINGYLIFFQPEKGMEAYTRINSIEPDKVYRWDQIEIDDHMVNVLVGKRENRGSSDLEYFAEWSGRKDPFFNQGLEEVSSMLEDNSKFDWDFRALFRLQMAYSLLWTAIERYAGLKYHLGGKVIEKILQIAQEDSFAEGLKRYVSSQRSVICVTDLEKYTLAPNNPLKAIKYYYQVRSNAVHRGKAVTRDFDTMRSSLEELLKIFQYMIEESFKKS